MRALGLLLIVTAAVQGCASFRTADVGGGDSLVMDASRRLVTNVRPGPGSVAGQVTPERLVCAEPSPDVATAVSRSLGLTLSAAQYGSVGTSYAATQAIAQLAERGATVQLLRDVLFRACEAYANGAISNTTYAMITGRLGDITATLLLGELAAGSFGRSLAGAGGTAEAHAVAEAIDALKPKPKAGTPPAGGPADADKPKDDAGGTSDARTSITVVTGGAITGRQSAAEAAHEVARIHQTFMGDDSLSSLLVACVTALSQSPVRFRDDKRETELAQLCRETVFKNFDAKVPAFLDAKTKAAVAVIRAHTEKAYADAVAKCFEAQAKGQGKPEACDGAVAALRAYVGAR